MEMAQKSQIEEETAFNLVYEETPGGSETVRNRPSIAAVAHLL